MWTGPAFLSIRTGIGAGGDQSEPGEGDDNGDGRLIHQGNGARI
jgi:hypothetical protein